MSFSSEIKEELAGQVPAARHCQLAELAAIASACGTFSLRQGGRLFFIIQSENPLAVRKAAMLIFRSFRIRPEVSVVGGGNGQKSRLFLLAVLEDESVSRLLKALKFMTERGALRDPERPPSGLLVQSSCCRRAFLRGSFLASGSLSNPERSYHLEISSENMDKAEQIRDLITGFDIEAKVTVRKNTCITYIKESDGIADFLKVVEAPKGLIRMENIRILHGISGRINRSVNCETANLNKTVSAAVEQIRCIEKLQAEGILETLPEPLREMAMVRLENPDTPLKDLGALLDPPVGKSGVNHRLRRLVQLAGELL